MTDDPRQAYADAVKYTLGVNNNASGLLTIVAQQADRILASQQEIKGLQASVSILNAIRDSVERFCESEDLPESRQLIEAGRAIDIADEDRAIVYLLNRLRDRIKFPQFKTPCSPEELEQQVKEWIQEQQNK